jgi:hypothetical protein
MFHLGRFKRFSSLIDSLNPNNSNISYAKILVEFKSKLLVMMDFFGKISVL